MMGGKRPKSLVYINVKPRKKCRLLKIHELNRNSCENFNFLENNEKMVAYNLQIIIFNIQFLFSALKAQYYDNTRMTDLLMLKDKLKYIELHGFNQIYAQ